MLRNFCIILLLTVSLSSCGQSELATAREAYEAGDYDVAQEKLLPLAKAGNPVAQYNLGFMYYEGLGVKQDYAEAVKWFRKAMEQDFELAMNGLAWIFATSPDETIRDGIEAVRLAEAYLKVHNDGLSIEH